MIVIRIFFLKALKRAFISITKLAQQFKISEQENDRSAVQLSEAPEKELIDQICKKHYAVYDYDHTCDLETRSR